MSNKALRLLIADADLLQRIKLEKMLNQLGYYRIAPISSFEELQGLTRSVGVAFDLLIINTALVHSRQVNLLKYCHDNPLIRHTLIYDGQCALSSMVSVSVSQTLHLSLSQSPDFNSLRRCMEIVDPAYSPPVVERPVLRAVDTRTLHAPISLRANGVGDPAVVACAVGLSPKR
ncbi:chemotaxis protein CheY [Pseudomonas poae]|uniref:Chemotaxis protein CheY n=1 Tax=Pseudomonas poae TaxID=200451 RepID=A0A423EYL4_9PSED|nr:MULTISPECIES: chemotaxis protein CheY [Pseudomonas]ROM46175.1 chemotaxis protein CheY [Pseudomonas poae]TFF13572.1 chemotaxis protein CheY [Pseudomonas sp. JMN1]TFF15744.1 chemotaxis protein CheY [Pseudomonas sp. BCA17]TFF30522.1 chemotaxis protein CheY [Pseudomonas sp. BCA14]TFF33104.1 chemotaxis protein CheY [Pseudomonas sp. BCA13]